MILYFIVLTYYFKFITKESLKKIILFKFSKKYCASEYEIKNARDHSKNKNLNIHNNKKIEFFF